MNVFNTAIGETAGPILITAEYIKRHLWILALRGRAQR